jgi:ornithine--oxo-acid transaminase
LEIVMAVAKPDYFGSSQQTKLTRHSSFDEELNFAIGVRQLCKKYNILFIADEVRMGSGKSGMFLCSDWMGPENKPDMVVMSKSITGGAYPASYIFGHDEVMDLVGGYESVATFGMAPAAIAATRATLKIIDEERQRPSLEAQSRSRRNHQVQGEPPSRS